MTAGIRRVGSWSSRDVIDVEDSLRDSVSMEVFQGLNGGGTLGQTNGSTHTRPNDNVSDCSKRVSKSSLEEDTEQSDRCMWHGGLLGCSAPCGGP